MRLNWWDSGWQRYQLNNNRWWELDNLRQCGDQIWNQYKWRHLVTNFASNGSFGEMKYKNKADGHLSYMFGNVRQCLAQAARQAFQLQLIGHTHCCQHHHQGGMYICRSFLYFSPTFLFAYFLWFIRCCIANPGMFQVDFRSWFELYTSY